MSKGGGYEEVMGLLLWWLGRLIVLSFAIGAAILAASWWLAS